jgi:hypothetical protein
MVWYCFERHGTAHNGIVLYGTKWYGIVMVRNGTVRYELVWNCTEWHGTVRNGRVRYGMVWYIMDWYGTVRNGMLWYGTEWYDTV